MSKLHIEPADVTPDCMGVYVEFEGFGEQRKIERIVTERCLKVVRWCGRTYENVFVRHVQAPQSHTVLYRAPWSVTMAGHEFPEGLRNALEGVKPSIEEYIKTDHYSQAYRNAVASALLSEFRREFDHGIRDDSSDWRKRLERMKPHLDLGHVIVLEMCVSAMQGVASKFESAGDKIDQERTKLQNTEINPEYIPTG